MPPGKYKTVVFSSFGIRSWRKAELRERVFSSYSVISVLCRICVLSVLLGVADFETDVAEGQSQRQSHDGSQSEVEGQTDDGCGAELRRNSIGFLVTLCVTLVLEVAVAVVSMRGSILNVQPRSSMPYLLYARLCMFTHFLKTILFGSVVVGC